MPQWSNKCLFYASISPLPTFTSPQRKELQMLSVHDSVWHREWHMLAYTCSDIAHIKGVDMNVCPSRGGSFFMSPSPASYSSLPQMRRKYSMMSPLAWPQCLKNAFSCAMQKNERQTLLRLRVATICSPQLKPVFVSVGQCQSWVTVCWPNINTMQGWLFRLQNASWSSAAHKSSTSLSLAGSHCSTSTIGTVKAAQQHRASSNHQSSCYDSFLCCS